MSETLQKTLSQLHKGQQITVIYDGRFEDQRLQISGTLVSVDCYWKVLQVKNTVIDFSEICEIIQLFLLSLKTKKTDRGPSIQGYLPAFTFVEKYSFPLGIILAAPFAVESIPEAGHPGIAYLLYDRGKLHKC